MNRLGRVKQPGKDKEMTRRLRWGQIRGKIRTVTRERTAQRQLHSALLEIKHDPTKPGFITTSGVRRGVTAPSGCVAVLSIVFTS